MVVLGGRVCPRHRGQASLRGPFGYLGVRQLGAPRDWLSSYPSAPRGRRASRKPSRELRQPSQPPGPSTSPENTVPGRAGEEGGQDPVSRPPEPPVLR